MSKIEKNGGISYPSFLVNTQEPLANEFAQLRQEREQKELQQKLTELAKQKQDELDAKLANLELLPMGSKIIILPYPENPYRRVMSGSIIVDYTGSFINPDTGERDKLKELVGCAKVIEVGPEAKFVQVGDDVFYDTRTTYPVPFMMQGYQLTTEPQILCVLNENLKQRFNMI